MHPSKFSVNGFTTGSKFEELPPQWGFREDVPFYVDRETERRLVRRVDARIVPSSMMIYLLCFLDRSNIGNARVLNQDMNDSLPASLGLTNTQYYTALMIFLASYTVFETPSGYMLKRFRPSYWLAFLMFGWGAMTICLGFVSSFASLTAVRFLLGMFEAGLFPGLIYFLTFWYKPEERAIRIALILASATLAGAFGGAIAYGIGHMNGIRGLEGWRWLFILEGIPSCLSAIIVYFCFPNFPEDASWLNEDEQEIAIKRLEQVESVAFVRAKLTWKDAVITLKDWRLYLHYLVYVAVSVPFSSISVWTPTIVVGLGHDGIDAQLWTVFPYLIAFFITLLFAHISDRYDMRAWAAFVALAISGATFIAEGVLAENAFKARYGLLCIAVSFSFAAIPPLLSWLTANLRSTAAITLAVPLNVSIGQIGQIIGVYIYETGDAPGYRTGHFTNAAFLVFGALIVLLLNFVYVRRNRKLTHGEPLWML